MPGKIDMRNAVVMSAIGGTSRFSDQAGENIACLVLHPRLDNLV
jgi:hypothetical protein